MELYDVIIIGAGPAGGSTALHCAKAGLNVLVFEEHEKIGEPVHCGECLSEYACENVGLVLPKEVISKKVNGIRVIFPNGKKSIVPEKGYVLEKDKFEQWLINESKKQGAKLMLGTRATEFKKINKKWKIKTNKGEFNAKILIDASGVASVVSSKLELNKRFDSVIGIQHEMQKIENENYLDFYINPKLAREGYLWMIPKSNGRANVGLVTHEKNKAKDSLEKFLIEKNWKTKSIVKTFGGLIPISGPLEKTFDDGLILVGDAAGFTSPMFEGGTHLSLKSGQMASEVILKAIKKNDFSKELFKEYETKWKNEFPEYKKILKGKNAFYSFSEEEINFIANQLPESFENFNIFKKILFGLKIIIGNPKLLKKDFILAMTALDYSNAKYYGW